MAGEKRKRVVLTIADKLSICDALKKKTATPNELAKRYNVGTSTISDIKRSEAKLRGFVSEKLHIGLKGVEKKAKCLKTSDYEHLDQALYIWFRQLREKNVPVSGDILMEKASDFYQQLYPDAEKDFLASTGYQTKFCHRYGIRNLAISGETEIAGESSAEDFIEWFENDGLGYEHFDDVRIVEHVSRKGDDEEEEEVLVEKVDKKRPVTHAEAYHHIDQFLTYLRYEGLADPVSTATCLRWREMVAERRASSRKQSSGDIQF